VDLQKMAEDFMHGPDYGTTEVLVSLLQQVVTETSQMVRDVTYQHRCKSMKEHVAGDLLVPCKDCYSLRVETLGPLPYVPPTAWKK